MQNLVDNVFLKRVGLKVIVIIQRRTKKGTFLPGSSSNASQYTSESYKKKRAKKGLQTNKVDMMFNSGASSYRNNLGIISVINNQIDISWRAADKKKLATFHEIMGAGKNKRFHKIIGLLPKEEEKLKSLVQTEVVKNLKKWAEKQAKGKT